MFKAPTTAVALALAWMLQAAPSQAVTISFAGLDVDPYIENGFSIDVARIVHGNCSVAP